MKRKICKACGKIIRIGFRATDETWKAVVPQMYQKETICLDCFTAWGDEALIPWETEIKKIFPVSLHSRLFGGDGLMDLVGEAAKTIVPTATFVESIREVVLEYLDEEERIQLANEIMPTQAE